MKIYKKNYISILMQIYFFKGKQTQLYCNMNGNEGIEQKVKNLKQRNTNIEKINNKIISL